MPSEKLLNLDDIILDFCKDWFEKHVRSTLGRKHRKLPWSELHPVIDRSKFKVEHSPPEFDTDLNGKIGKPGSQVAFKSTYTNNTSGEQEHNFRTERHTKSLYTFEVTKGVELEANVELEIQVVPALQAKIGFSGEVNMQTTRTKTVEEELTWSADSKILVPAHTRTTAELVVAEEEMNGNFKVTSTYSGRFIVKVLDKKGTVLTTIHVANLRKLLADREGFFIDEAGDVCRTSEGRYFFKYGLEQRMNMIEERLSPSQ